jgi:hypothetical protein
VLDIHVTRHTSNSSVSRRSNTISNDSRVIIVIIISSGGGGGGRGSRGNSYNSGISSTSTESIISALFRHMPKHTEKVLGSSLGPISQQRFPQCSFIVTRHARKQSGCMCQRTFLL